MIRVTSILIALPVWWVAVAAHAEDTLMPRIVHEACAEYQRGKPYEIVARFEDESQLFDPKAMYRTRSDSHWRAAPFKKDDTTENFIATIKSKELKGPLEYFIEVFDEWGNGPARMGSPDTPIRMQASRSAEGCIQVPTMDRPLGTTSGSTPSDTQITATPAGGPLTATGGGTPGQAKTGCDADDRPVYCEAWLWAVVGGAVVIGGGVGGYFLFAAGGDDPPAQRDSLTLTVIGPDPTTAP